MASETSTAVRATTDTEPDDAEWDTFVDAVSGGTYVQTSAWAQVKATQGWAAGRVKLYDGGHLVGGCQVLLKMMSGVVGVGYVPRGPLVDVDRPDLLDAVLDELQHFARRRRLVQLKVQPPMEAWATAAELHKRGFAESNLSVCPVATTRIDLRRDLDDILRATSKSVRNGISRARRHGLVVRHGTEEDLDFFCQMVQRTAERHAFQPYPAAYYERMWWTFAARGQAELLIAEYDGRPLSSQLLLTGNDTVTSKMIGWSGERSDLHPNRALEWEGIAWAKAGGFRWYDLDGINASVAVKVLAGADDIAIPGPQQYKLSFGGQVLVSPGAVDRSPRAVASVLRTVQTSKRGKRLGKRLAGRAAARA
jgi:peptidoglycan pentaglycine glycine transferase (the first glycine)